MIAGRGSIDQFNQVAYALKLRAAAGIFHGGNNPLDHHYMASCQFIDRSSGTSLIFTRDEGYHSSGWWKNPDYERCYHLSLSFRWYADGQAFHLPKNARLTEKWLRAFFGADQSLLWCEPPSTVDGRAADTWHYRLFCTPDWKPFKPAGEVYDRTWTPAGWLSFSDAKYAREKAR